MTSSSYLRFAIAVVAFLSITTITTARPCKTFLISSYSLSITPENPNLESDFTSTRFVTVFTIRRLNPHHVVPFFVNRRHEKPQIQSDRSLPLISDNINSFRDRTRDILSVVVALLFGVGCGALTAATMYLVWALVVNRQSYDFEEEEDDYENDESDAASLKKLGYVKIPAPAPAPVKEAA
ncbi:hypothetical protein AtNW77_Chr1g0066071 [Arabidopsis thaliana]|uniref:At1g65720/F1E22_13 n=4 Tax=Arabidopsis TaxID=3701 RepID=Q9SHY3_ARATH|nr:uncharacterized protein AT1G65720 [Arabidopsis thaliana]KAG7650680.1 hypothetical protein ISN45_At01g056170 [Arabidopsis thaliana x Arabidopsis arenosa]KAG7658550.1 hypothetical protein ISN44_As01g055180 [Arabidopsis suecica]AAF23840.1 F1E22.9 [Arabidopsis thaliana]AAK55666.1 At1g65720/F1E22_13 [Arabidopsis thaliana]AAK55729.1 At1g65720/F1E22_13 [Arabidopsis thaliana]|eukprot:NP_564863.1 transmembrane protein [Arabidopsis thaliana]